MTRIIQDLRIGTKLAITTSMIYLQVTGGAAVGRARQQVIAQSAAEAKASVRGMQVGIRDILLATNPAEIQKGAEYFADRRAAAPNSRARWQGCRNRPKTRSGSRGSRS